MLLHGALPNDFFGSILIPIPKGPPVDVRKTQNYRAFALSSFLGKIWDNIIIISRRNVIKTSDLQFRYKSNCSTIMCSTLVIKTIQYFTQMQSPVYVTFIDASKAFDRLCHIELFNILSADDIVLLFPSLYALKHSITRGEDYAKKNPNYCVLMLNIKILFCIYLSNQ